MVSGSYKQLGEDEVKKIKKWVEEGNTLITIANGSSWAIKSELINESLVESKKDSNYSRKRYVDSSEYIGREKIGGSILSIDLDLTHPISFGYNDNSIPVYKNNNVFVNKTKDEYSSVGVYSDGFHIDGFISESNRKNFIPGAASIIISKIGAGRVVVFADNPNFRGTWYGTNKLFLNAIFLGNNISVPTN